jgi:site-specific recombinase XerD
MLERYFLRPATVDRIQASWIAGAIEQYVSWLAARGYAPRNVLRRVPLLQQFGDFAQAHGAVTWQDLPAHVESFTVWWAQRRGQPPRRPATHAKLVTQTRSTVEQMLRLVVPGFTGRGRPHRGEPFLGRAGAFFQFLREERGLRPETLEHYQHDLRAFERYLQGLGLHDFAALSPAVLGGFIAESSRRLGRSGLRNRCGVLRVFLRYLAREGLAARALSAQVELPRQPRLATLPQALPWALVRQVLDGVDQRDARGKRDYAILLLLVTYGLRADEVTRLTLDDLDWDRDRLRIPERKAGHSTAYPLSPTVGAAILAYLQHGRPQTADRHLFCRVVAPPTPLTNGAISARVAHYLRRAGIAAPRLGAHTLRHTCVQRLVDAGLPFPVVGGYVGHRGPDATALYTKIATEALREVACGDGEAIL